MNVSISDLPDVLSWSRSICDIRLEQPEDTAPSIQVDATGALPAPTPFDGLPCYDVEKEGAFISLLQQALTEIGFVREGAAAQIVTAYVKTVLIRRSDENFLSSSSWPGRPGIIGIANMENREGSLARIMDVLVHEAIHSLLYDIEQRQRFYVSDEACRACILISPWTGKELYLHSYIHACFVWFGQWKFWSHVDRTRTVDLSEAARLGDRALRGFSKLPVRILGNNSAFVEKSIRDTLGIIEDACYPAACRLN